MQTSPQSDPILASFIAYANQYQEAYNRDNGLRADNALNMVFTFDGLPRVTTVGPAEPSPQLRALWIKGPWLYECTSLAPVRPLRATWDPIGDHTSLWTSSIAQASPSYVPVGMPPNPDGSIPGSPGTLMRNRLYLVGPASTPNEAVPFSQVQAVHAEVEELTKKVRALTQGVGLPRTVKSIEVEEDPKLPLDAVNLRWATAQVAELSSWVEEIRHAVTTRPLPDYTEVERQVQLIRTAMLKIQDVDLLARTTGARFEQKVFLPYDPSHPPQNDDEAVAWGFVKHLRNESGETEIRCVDGSQVWIDPDLEPDVPLVLDIDVRPWTDIAVTASLYLVGLNGETVGNPLTSIRADQLVGSTFRLQLELTSLMSVTQTCYLPLDSDYWVCVRPWDVCFPILQPRASRVVVADIKWKTSAPGPGIIPLDFRHEVPISPIPMPPFV